MIDQGQAENPVPYLPKKAALYQNIIEGLSANSLSSKNFRNMIVSHLTPDLDSIKTAALLGDNLIEARHPLDTLPKSERTADIHAMCRVYSHLKSVFSLLSTEDIESFGDYARLYGMYRNIYLEAVITEAKEGRTERYLILQNKYQEVGQQLHQLQYNKKEKNEDYYGLWEEVGEIPKLFRNLIEGQILARLRPLGKDLDPLLLDPTLERLTEDDIRAASYQYDLIIDRLFPKTEQTAENPS